MEIKEENKRFALYDGEKEVEKSHGKKRQMRF